MSMERYLLETYGTAEKILNDNRRIMESIEREEIENPIAELPEEVVEVSDASDFFVTDTEETAEEIEEEVE
jgi:hypothetical protein